MTTALTTAKHINNLHSQIVSDARTTLEKAIEIGELLTQRKATLKHGEWLPWVKANLKFSRDTTANYMRVHAKCGTLPHLNLTEAYKLLAESAKEQEQPEPEPTAPEPEPSPVEETAMEVVEEEEGSTTEPEPETFTPGPPENGMQYAAMAVNQLEKIHRKDEQREKAFRKVELWIMKELLGDHVTKIKRMRFNHSPLELKEQVYELKMAMIDRFPRESREKVRQLLFNSKEGQA